MAQLSKDNFEYWFGDVVYLKTDKEQNKRIVTGISLRPGGITYALTCGNAESWHYPFVIATEVDVLLQTTN